MSAPPPKAVNCADLSSLMHNLEFLRKKDDLIIVEMNNLIPTKSFKGSEEVKGKCANIQKQINELQQARRALIERCVSENETKLRELEGSNPGLAQIARGTARVMRDEFDVEEVIKARTEKALFERCRDV